MKQLIYFLVLCLVLPSCVPHKKIAYFQDGAPRSEMASNYISTIQPNDIISVSISSLSEEANKLFDLNSNIPDPNYSSNSYLVDIDGNIEIPLIGTLQVMGKTTTEVKAIIKEEVAKYVKQPTVNVRFVNFRVTVLGEVTRPGVYSIANESATVLEALGLAGDLTIFGNRQTIQIIRKKEEKQEFHLVDLTSKDFIGSSAYYLKNNDVIYVEPSKGRTSSDDNAYRIIPIILSSLTFVTVMVTAFGR